MKHTKFTRPPASYMARRLVLFVVTVNAFILPAVAAAKSPAIAPPGVIQGLTSGLTPGLSQSPTSVLNNQASASATAELQPTVTKPAKLANFGSESFSSESRKLADWVVDSADNGKLPFMIIDKVQAQVFVFDAQGQLRAAAPALLGLAIGDHTVPGIGQRKLSSIRPDERTTPAGRFVASLDRDIHGDEVLWVDYDSALSLHRLVKGQPKERRAERLASPTPLDNRVSFGCINVPPKFYEQVISPSFTGTNGIVYVLPEIRSAHDVFGSYDVQDASRKQASVTPAPPSDSTAQRSLSAP